MSIEDPTPSEDRPTGPTPPTARPVPRRAAPHSAAEIALAWRRPDRLAELVLGAPERLVADAEDRRGLGPLLALLSTTAALFAIPYACVHSLAGWWKVATLLLGTTLLCVPSLLVFAAYLGLRLRVAPLLVPALSIPAVAALFSFGFAPILSFLRATMDDASGGIGWRDLSDLLLAVAVAAGVGQLWRCLAASNESARRSGFGVLVLLWLAVFVHVAWRMARVLGLI